MLPAPQPAYFVIADISGYTTFLAAAELDHAQDIIADLMEIVVRALRPTFRLAKFEGDAAFLCSTQDTIDDSQLQDLIEQAYVRFRRRLRDIKQSTTCTCRACALMGDLDFKFAIHRGEMVRQRMAGREELAGRDVILVHRLLKNHVSETFGTRAYALYTHACFRLTDMDPAAQALLAHSETIDIIGDVKLWVRELAAVWDSENATTHAEVTPADAYLTLEFDVDAPRATAWEYLTVPRLRETWWPADGIAEPTARARRGVGTVNHCMHGKDAIIEELLDWRPFDYFTLTTLLPVPGAPKITMTRAFEERLSGTTHIVFRIARPKPKDKDFVDKAAGRFATNMTAAFAKLRQVLANAQASSQAGDGVPAVEGERQQPM